MKSDHDSYSVKRGILKKRNDSDQAKVAISMTLLSIVVLVTLADRNLMTRISPDGDVQAPQTASRGIASISESSLQPEAVTLVSENPAFLKDLASRDFGPNASIGHKPSNVERLAFGLLEGKYTVHLQQGKLTGIELSDANLDEAKRIDDPSLFLDSQRELLPEFKQNIHLGSLKEGSDTVENYQLLKQGSVPVANVQFRLDDVGHLIAMHVSQLQVAFK